MQYNGNISSRFASNSEANASELLANLEEDLNFTVTDDSFV